MQLFRRLRRPPEERFARDVLAAVQATGRVARAWYDAEAFAIGFQREADGAGGWIYLHSTFRECAGVRRADRVRRIQALVAAVTSAATGGGWADVAPRLRPVLRGAAFGQSGQPGTGQLLARPAPPYLVELVVVDEPTSMAYVLRPQLDEWGIEPEEVFATARANLRRLADAAVPPGTGAEPNTVLRLVDSGDAYFTSMVLLDGFLAGLGARVGGRPVAFIHDRDHLTVMPDDPAAVAAMLERIERDYTDAARSLSPMAYTCDEHGAVVPYAASEPGRLADLVHRSEVLLAATEYQAQKEALDLRNEREGRDVFVGSLIVAERPDGTLFSVAVWSDDCVTLLPRADLVCFQSGAESVMVPWPAVARTTGLSPEAGHLPERYLVTAWPEAALLDHLRAESVTP